MKTGRTNQNTMSMRKINAKLVTGVVLTSFLFLFATTLNAQSWVKNYDAHFNAGAMDLLATPDGGFVVAGFNSDPSIIGDFRSHCMLMKVDAEGDKQWIQHYPTEDRSSHFNDLLQTSDNSYLLVGSRQYQANLSSSEAPDYGQGFVVKTDLMGNEIWQVEHGIEYREESFFAGTETTDGNYIVVGTAHDTTASSWNYPYNLPLPKEHASLLLTKISNDGNILWTDNVKFTHTSPPPFSFTDTLTVRAFSVFPTNDGGAVISVEVFDNGPDHQLILYRVNSQGAELWRQNYELTPSTKTRFGWKQIMLNDGSIVLSSHTSNDQVHLIQLDTLGNILLQQSYDFFEEPEVMAVAQTLDGGFVITGLDVSGSEESLYWMKVDAQGNFEWKNTYGRKPSLNLNLDGGTTITQLADSCFAIAGISYIREPFSSSQFFHTEVLLLKTLPNGTLFSNEISGRVVKDENENCLVEDADVGFEGLIVVASDSTNQYYGYTDSMGYYKIPINNGSYEVDVWEWSYLYQTCIGQDIQTVNIEPSSDSIIVVDFPIILEADCPLLTVDMSTSIAEACFISNYYIDYCNYGTVVANDAFVEVNLDTALQIISTSIPYTIQSDSTYIFEVGDVAIGECGRFWIKFAPNCNIDLLGYIACSQAHIYPDTLCGPVPDNWDMASVNVEGECLGDSIIFRLINNGQGDMQETLDYFIVVDEVIMLQGSFQLNATQDTSIVIPVIGAVHRLEASQSTGHPGISMPNVTIYNCPFFEGVSNTFDWFAQDDQDLFVDIDCQEIVGSFDPNDKQAFPVGYGEEHYIEPNTQLEYLVRFQNTGTAPAHFINIKDTLSPYLDLRTLEVIASSHTYEWELLPSRILKITYNNINLPDSTSNEPESHGFIKYKVRLMNNVPLESVITNRAGIYFDYNPVVLTNTVFHTIGIDFVPIEVINDALSTTTAYAPINTYPNPAYDRVHFEIPKSLPETVDFHLYNSKGQLVQQAYFNHRNYMFRRKNLPNGVYFYTIRIANNLLYSGKIILR